MNDTSAQIRKALDNISALATKRNGLPRVLRNLLRNQDSINSSIHSAVSLQAALIDALISVQAAPMDELISVKEGSRTKESDAWGDAWGEPCYKADGMCNYYKNMDWIRDPEFVRAYAKGMNSGHKMGRPKGSENDIHIEWRVHMILWAAQQAMHFEGDFVECGVNTGILSLAVCDYLNFDKLGDRKFWLFDTFRGIPEDQASASEMAHAIGANETSYEECYELVVRNFAPYPNARLVRGKVPESFANVDIQRVAYLSIDMNIAKPEVAAMEFFWDKLVKGAPVVFDDYGWAHCGEQYEALNAFARSRGVKIATLPTGQGLLIKP
jgi:O-methyltransferase